MPKQKLTKTKLGVRKGPEENGIGWKEIRKTGEHRKLWKGKFK